MINRLYTFRFELFLCTQVVILFGSLVIPDVIFERWVSPLFLSCNIAAGILLVFKGKKSSKIVVIFTTLFAVGLVASLFKTKVNDGFNYLKLAAYFIFYGLVTIEIIRQVWNAKVVGKNVILGVISGYISLGLLAFLLCMCIEIITPHSFSGLSPVESEMTEGLMYYSYITLMTIGYGDILPITVTAKKAAIFIGLLGQIYLVILTAIVVGKYINQKNRV